MTKDEIKAKLKTLAGAVLAEDAGVKLTPEALVEGTEAGFDLAADFLHNIGRIADAMDHIARNVPEKDAR